MRLPTCFTILYLTVTVLANPQAAVWEKVWLWEAYLIELSTLATPNAATIIAPGCYGSQPGAGRRCYFKEFIDYIDNRYAPAIQLIENPENLNINIEEARDSLWNNGYRGAIQANRVFPSGSYTTMYPRIAELVSGWKRARLSTGVTNGVVNSVWISNNLQHYENLDDSLAWARNERIYDLSNYFRPRYQAALPGAPMVTHPTTAGEVFDLIGTLAVVGDNPAQRTAIIDYFNNYNNVWNDGRTHASVIDRMWRAEDFLQSC